MLHQKISLSEGHPDYTTLWVSDCRKWRVIRCVDDLQYILQHYRSPKWRSKSYHREWQSIERRWEKHVSFQ